MWWQLLEARFSFSCYRMAVLRHQSTPPYKKQNAENSRAFTTVPDDICLEFWVPTVALSCLLQFTPFLDVNTWVQCTSQNEGLSFESKCIFLCCWTWVTHSNDNDGALFSVVCFSSFQQPSTWNMRRTSELINYPYFYPFSVGVVAKHWDKFF